MQLLNMRPEQIQDAVKRDVPILIASGVMEYHGPHLPLGTDILITATLCEEIERRCECVLAPFFSFGPTSYWAGGPEEGEIDFAPEPFFQYAKEVFKGLMDIGFKRIYVMQMHQGPEGLQAVCLKRAAAELLWETGRNWGTGWGRMDPDKLPHKDFFHWIQVGFPDTFSKYPEGKDEKIPLGHGGKGETQLIMARLSDTVRLEALKSITQKVPYWLENAQEATMEEGNKWFEFCVQGWVEEIIKKRW